MTVATAAGAAKDETEAASEAEIIVAARAADRTDETHSGWCTPPVPLPRSRGHGPPYVRVTSGSPYNQMRKLGELGASMRECSPLDSLSDILADVPDLVFVYAGDGRYLYVNRAAAAFLGSDPLEVIGRHWRELGYSPEVMEPLIERADHVARSCEPSRFRVTTSPERGSRSLDLSLTPLRCGDGDVIGVLAIAHDISEFF